MNPNDHVDLVNPNDHVDLVDQLPQMTVMSRPRTCTRLFRNVWSIDCTCNPTACHYNSHPILPTTTTTTTAQPGRNLEFLKSDVLVAACGPVARSPPPVSHHSLTGLVLSSQNVSPRSQDRLHGQPGPRYLADRWAAVSSNKWSAVNCSLTRHSAKCLLLKLTIFLASASVINLDGRSVSKAELNGCFRSKYHSLDR